MTDVWDLVIRAAGDLAWPGSTERWRQLTGGVDGGRTARRLPGAESAVPVGGGRGALGEGKEGDDRAKALVPVDRQARETEFAPEPSCQLAPGVHSGVTRSPPARGAPGAQR